MAEKCKCGGSGQKGDGSPCVCRVMAIYNRYLAPFRNGAPPTPAIKAMVSRALFRHASMEGAVAARQGAGEVIIPRHWYMVDGSHRYTATDGTALGTPAGFYMQFFFEYLVRTKEYVSYEMLDLVALQNLYYADGRDAEVAGPGFYGFGCGTFLIRLGGELPGKEGMNVLRHFLNTYKGRNILVYAVASYRQAPRITKWTGTSYDSVPLPMEKSLCEIMETEYGDTFVDLETYIRK
jgi:hypothetical protein